MRDAPLHMMMEAFRQAGARVCTDDPKAVYEYPRICGEDDDPTLPPTQDAALAVGDALTIVTKWKSFHAPNFDAIRAALKVPVIFDGRNTWNPQQLARHGNGYNEIGRGLSGDRVGRDYRRG